MNKKRVLFLMPNLGGGGAEKVLVNLVNNLDSNLYDITIRTLFIAGVNASRLNNNIKLIEGYIKQFSGNVLLQKAFSPRLLYKLFIKEHYDIIVSYLEGSTARIVSGCPYNDTKIYTWIHVEFSSVKNACHCFRSYSEALQCYQKFQKIICVSNSVKENFDSIFHLDEMTEVIYNTLETDEIIKNSKEPINPPFTKDSINVVSVGRLTEQKGYDRLINVHHKLIQEGFNIHLYLLGTGDQEDELKNLCQRHHLSDSVHFLGFQNNPQKYIANADIFICSSRREGFSTVISEAIIIGKPIISTLCSGVIEQLGNSEYGIVVENSEQGIYDGLKMILTDPNKLKYYQIKVRERSNIFTKENTVKKVEELFCR